MTKTITIPEGLERLGESFESLMSELEGSIRLARLNRTPGYGDIEDRIAGRAAEVERESHRAMLQALDIDCPRVVIDEKPYRRVLREDSTYHTMAGDVVVNGVNSGEGSLENHPMFETYKKQSESWRLLLQLASDEDLGMMWGDMGKLYFWIKNEDLEKRDFSKTWMILQCG